ncbi:hypothetical protein JL721_5706 [Aureococcus anophagefferens]|nr:hypothetical protein JL721_5706 [Aureococcus anophagefferens]
MNRSQSRAAQRQARNSRARAAARGAGQLGSVPGLVRPPRTLDAPRGLEARGGAPHGGPRRIEPHSPTSPFSGAYNRPVDGVPFFADGPPLGGRAVGAPDWSFNGEAATSP